MRQFLREFKTANLIIQQALLQECEELVCVLNTWEEQKFVTGHADTEISYFKKAITEGNLPPNGIKEHANLMTIKEKESNKLVGFFEIYHGYPDDQTLWIGLLLINKPFRNKGFGKEVMVAIESQAQSKGWSNLGIGVYLKNWPALRFWTPLGFDRITGIHGDKEYSADTFALIGLKKSLKGKEENA